MSAIDQHRSARVDLLCTVLVQAAPGSTCVLVGSLGRGTGDAYSDIDLHWGVGEAASAVANDLPEILGRVSAVESLRWDETGDTSRLAFIRFVGWPLFSRLDLQITGDFYGAPVIGDPWTATESALMNVVGALKAHLRRQPDFDGLLERGFRRIQATDPGGSPSHRMQALVDAATAQNPALTQLGDDTTSAIHELSR